MFSGGWAHTEKCVDQFLAPSQFVRDKFVEHGWDGSKFAVLQHFQKIPEVTGAPRDGPLLYCGRLSAEKGVDDLLRAMQKVPSMRLVVAGDGPQRRELQELAASLKLGNVEFVGQVGPRSGTCGLRNRSSRCCLLMPTKRWARRFWNPTRAGGPSWRRISGRGGSWFARARPEFSIATGDVDELAAAIETLGSRPELATKMGRAGREFVRQRHTPEGHYRKMLGLYEDLVSAKARKKWGLVATAEPAPWMPLPGRTAGGAGCKRGRDSEAQVARGFHRWAGSHLEIQRD